MSRGLAGLVVADAMLRHPKVDGVDVTVAELRAFFADLDEVWQTMRTQARLPLGSLLK
ncbi:hypothetical protein [Nocardioides limicola]|uniref:hypothetical protein n=1 Tax=Nocardioides limicola TaxID=2803368 RepID=UPI00193C2670|nr:hypothetical protein [Nocardioides sp. DJM-14]